MSDAAKAPTWGVPYLQIFGFDPSLSATGMASSIGTWTLKTKPGPRRLVGLSQQVSERLEFDVKAMALAAIEDLPMNARSAGLTGMAQGVIRLALEEACIPYFTVSPASLKKFATGSGKASKDDMGDAMVKLNGNAPSDDNQVDAWWLRTLAIELESPGSLPWPWCDRAPGVKVKGLEEALARLDEQREVFGG